MKEIQALEAQLRFWINEIDFNIASIKSWRRKRNYSGGIYAVIWTPLIVACFWKRDWWFGGFYTVMLFVLLWINWHGANRVITSLRELKLIAARGKLQCEQDLKVLKGDE